MKCSTVLLMPIFDIRAHCSSLASRKDHGITRLSAEKALSGSFYDIQWLPRESQVSPYIPFAQGTEGIGAQGGTKAMKVVTLFCNLCSALRCILDTMSWS